MVDLATIKTYLGITGTEQDAALTALRDRVQAVIERILQWYFGPPRPIVEYLDGRGRMDLWLHQPPTDGVEIDIRSGTTWREVDSGDYELDGRRLFNLHGYWAPGVRNYRAQYSEGFVTPPGDIVQLLLETMQTFVSVETTAGTGGGTSGSRDVQSESIGDYSYTLSSGGGGSAGGDGTLDGAVTSRPSWANVWHSWRRGRP